MKQVCSSWKFHNWNVAEVSLWWDLIFSNTICRVSWITETIICCWQCWLHNFRPWKLEICHIGSGVQHSTITRCIRRHLYIKPCTMAVHFRAISVSSVLTNRLELNIRLALGLLAGMCKNRSWKVKTSAKYKPVASRKYNYNQTWMYSNQLACVKQITKRLANTPCT